MRFLRLLLVAGCLLASGSSISCNTEEHGMMENMKYKPAAEKDVKAQAPVHGKKPVLPGDPDLLEAPPIQR